MKHKNDSQCNRTTDADLEPSQKHYKVSLVNALKEIDLGTMA